MVGGSCALIDTGKHRILIDFGLFYGAEYEDRNGRVDFDPATIDVVLLTHAHIDHAGRIPLLYRKGFNGKTIGTDATKALVEVNLKMGLAVAEKQGAALYDDDYRRMMENFLALPYDQLMELNSEVSVRFRHAGHIMGSSLIELWIRGREGTVKVVATGDLGNDAWSLLKKPDIIREGDYVIVESTAGPIKRKNKGFDGFGKEIQKTLNGGGSVLIPAFVLDRTQRVLYAIGTLKRKGIIPQDTPVYVDSGTARKITGIYRDFRQFFSPEALKSFQDDGDPLSFSGLREISSRDALMMHDRGEPAIYISSSAMLDHANAPRHLEKMIENPRNLLAIVSWQAPGTPGWKLQRKAKTLEIPLEEPMNGGSRVRFVEKPVNMRVKTFDMFSNHADGCQILTWLSGFATVKEVFVVHGDRENALGMAELITERLGFKASVPAYGSMFPLSRDGQDYAVRKRSALCSGMETSNKFRDFSD